MTKTLYDIQKDTQSTLGEFEFTVAELMNTKYILADKKISAVLKVIAKSKKLYSVIEACMKGFDFKQEFDMAKAATANSEIFALNIPNEPKKQIAFVFCLLLSFDTNQTDLKKFLSAFYHNSLGMSYEFNDFCNSAIKPFYENLVSAYNGDLSVAPILQNLPASPKSGTEIDPAVLSLLQSKVIQLIEIISKSPNISVKEKEELLLVAEAFYGAISLGVKKTVKTMYISLRNAILCTSIADALKDFSNELDDIVKTII